MDMLHAAYWACVAVQVGFWLTDASRPLTRIWQKNLKDHLIDTCPAVSPVCPLRCLSDC